MKKIVLVIIIAIAGTIAVGVGLYFGGSAIYNAGVSDGRNAMSDEVAESLNVLGSAVSEKESFQKELNNALTEVPSELNAEGIDLYIGKLTEVIDRVNVEDVKTALNKYLEQWKAFKETYTSQQNNSIGEKFNELKASAVDTSKQLKTIYDERIRNAIENL